MFDTAIENEEQQKEQERLQKRHKESMDNALALLMESRDGKYFLNYFLEMTGVLKANYSSPEIISFNEGRRSIGCELIQLLDNHDKNNLAKLFAREEEK